MSCVRWCGKEYDWGCWAVFKGVGDGELGFGRGLRNEVR